eukprot:6185527-Pleurochrysis_carterae.AAC.3
MRRKGEEGVNPTMPGACTPGARMTISLKRVHSCPFIFTCLGIPPTSTRIVPITARACKYPAARRLFYEKTHVGRTVRMKTFEGRRIYLSQRPHRCDVRLSEVRRAAGQVALAP